jgi:hypothetical protein
MGTLTSPYGLRNQTISGLTSSVGGVIFRQTANKTVANTGTETTLFSGTGTLTIPGSYLQVGSIIQIHLSGLLGSAVVLPTIKIKVYLNANVICDTTAVTLLAQLTAGGWEANATLTCRTAAVAGKVNGTLIMPMGIANTPLQSALGDVTVDTTIDQVLDVKVTWGTADALNTITMNNGWVAVLG